MALAPALALLLAAGARGARPAMDLEAASLGLEGGGGGPGCAEIVSGAEPFPWGGSCKCAADRPELTGEDPACTLAEDEDAFLPVHVKGKGCACGHPRFVQMHQAEPRCPILAEVATMDECSEAIASLRIGQGPNVHADPQWANFCSVWTSSNNDIGSRFNPFPPNELQGNVAGYAKPVCKGGSYYLQGRTTAEEKKAVRRGCPRGHEIESVEECRAALALMTGRTVSRYRLEPAEIWSCYLEENLVEGVGDGETAVFLYNDNVSREGEEWHLLEAVCRTSNSTTIAEQAAVTLNQSGSSADSAIPAVRRLSATGLNGARRSKALVPFLLRRGVRLGSAFNATEYEREWEAAVEAFGIFFSDKFVDSDRVKSMVAEFFMDEMRRDERVVGEISHYTEKLTRLSNSSDIMSARSGARELSLHIANKTAMEHMSEMNRSVKERSVGEGVTSQVGEPIFFDENHSLKVPRGFMVLLTGSDYPEAHKCPNALACPGVTIKRAENGSYCTDCAKRSCATTYNHSTPGCVKCASKAGRSPTDGFTCKACGKYYWEVMRYIFWPLALFLAGMKSACNPAPAECFGSVLTIFLSFQGTAKLVLSAIKASPVATTLTENAERVRELLRLSEDASEGASGMASGSIDCILEQPADVISWLLLSATVPVAIFVLWLVGTVVLYHYTGRERPNYTVIILRPMAVFIKVFFPVILMGVCRAWPCFHTQLGSSRDRFFMMYNVETPCQDLTHDLLCVFAALLCCLLGPGLWLHITMRPASWGDEAKQAVWGVLNRPYKEGCEYWEVVMLARRMALASVAALCPISYSCQTQLKLVLAINVFALGAHAKAMPYKAKITEDMPRHLSMNSIELYSLITSCTTTLLVSYATEVGWTHYEHWDCRAAVLAIVLILAFSLKLLGLLLYTGSSKLQGLLQGGVLGTLAVT